MQSLRLYLNQWVRQYSNIGACAYNRALWGRQILPNFTIFSAIGACAKKRNFTVTMSISIFLYCLFILIMENTDKYMSRCIDITSAHIIRATLYNKVKLWVGDSYFNLPKTIFDPQMVRVINKWINFMSESIYFKRSMSIMKIF